MGNDGSYESKPSKKKVDCRACGTTMTLPQSSKTKLCADCRKVTLLIWPMTDKQNGDNWGHAALEIPLDDTYVSWWPAIGADKSKAGLAAQKGGYQDYKTDEKKEKSKPKRYKIKIGYNGQRNMVKWWNSFKRNGEYCATGMNCAKAVVTALKKGGRSFDICVGPWMPHDIWGKSKTFSQQTAYHDK